MRKRRSIIDHVLSLVMDPYGAFEPLILTESPWHERRGGANLEFGAEQMHCFIQTSKRKAAALPEVTWSWVVWLVPSGCDKGTLSHHPRHPKGFSAPGNATSTIPSLAKVMSDALATWVTCPLPLGVFGGAPMEGGISG